MGPLQLQNLEQIREETVMESYMAGMESGEYFAQLQLQSPQLQQAPFAIQSPPQQHHSGQLTTPMMTPQYDYSNSSMAPSTPLLASQSQTGFDITGAGVGQNATPTVPSTTLLPSSMEGSSNYGYPQFSTSINPLFSSPPAISSAGAFSPTSSNMPNYFTAHQAPPSQNTHSHQHHYMSGSILVQSVNTPQSHNSTQMAQDGSGMYMANSGMGVWDQYSMTNASPSVEVLMQQQQQQQQHQESHQMNGTETYQQDNSINGAFVETTPPMTPQRHPRLFHSQSQPGLRNLQQEQQKQQQYLHSDQQQHQQTNRRRQHSVHFPSEFLSGDLNMGTARNVSLPTGSYSAPIPTFASLSEMMQESPSGANMLGNPIDTAATFAETASLLSMSLPTSTHGFSFLDSPPPPMTLHQHHHFMPTSPPLSSTDLSIASTPTVPKSRSRAGSKSRSRPTSASSTVSVRNAGAPYSPSIPNNAAAPNGVANSRSPSLVPLSPIPPFRQGSATESELSAPPTPAYETGLIIVPGTPTGPNPTTPTTPTSGGKARRISRTKLPTKTRSRSSTITSPTSALGTPTEATGILMNSPFSLVLSEQDEKTFQSLAEQSENRAVVSTSPVGEDNDPFQLDITVQMHHHQQQQQQQQQYHQLDSNMFEMPLIQDMDEENYDADGIEDGADLGDEANAAGTGSVNSASTSPPNSSGKTMPCPIPSCTKTFTRPFNLNAHVKSHDTLKPYGCHLCSRVFSRKHDLQRHIRVHTGSKPYVCVNCQKAFARTDALCRHYKIEEPCKLFMQQDEVRKQAQQQVQQQLHQEQIELQQAQQAHAQAKALAQAQAQAEVEEGNEEAGSQVLYVKSEDVELKKVTMSQIKVKAKPDQKIKSEPLSRVSSSRTSEDDEQNEV
ncbi:hypothetical protein BGZ46_006211 [Entomortierella lignicola]|nr:hypothetical protein BGZ46_006211 [Entomortierella lignicola]